MVDEDGFDVFFSHSRADTPAVEVLAQRLRSEAGLRPFVDRWHLTPGMPWQDELNDALARSATVAVIIGPSEMGSWHIEEMRAAIDRAARTRDEFRVIPVLLPGADPDLMSPFLAQRTWVDFRAGLDDVSALTRLAAGVRGEAIDNDEFGLPDNPAPYRGLWRFEPTDDWLFFGRDDDVTRLIAKLRSGRFAAVIGASGSGKSSLVRGGLIPNLAKLRADGSGGWRTMVCTPGVEPCRSLAQQVAQLGANEMVLTAVDELTDRFANRDDGLVTAVGALTATSPDPVLLFVDQFEELFTLGRGSPEQWRPTAERFVANLATAVADPAATIRVVITLRADFVAAALSVPGLKDLLQDGQVMLGAMSGGELRQAIVRPAQAVGAFFEKGLVATIVGDVDAEPGALPLLQHALFELWTARRGPWLTIDAYERTGGVIGALSIRAQATYDDLPVAHQRLARTIFVRLSTLGDGVPDTRRRASRDELYPAGAAREDVDAVLLALSSEQARLIVVDGDAVEVAHETLLRTWGTLRGWLDSDREALRVHRRLSQAADEWATELDGDPAGLYRGARLAEATEWAAAHPTDLNDLESRFLKQSASLADSELELERRRSRKLRRRLVSATIALVLAVVGIIGAVWGLNQANASRATAELATTRAERLGTEARAREMAATSDQALQRDPELAVLLALESDRVTSAAGLATTPATATSMYFASTSSWSATLNGHTDLVRSAVFSPDGSHVVTASDDETARVWDLDGNPLADLNGHTGLVRSAVFSPDGSRVVTASDDETARVWDLDGNPLATLTGHTGPVYSAAFSPDGSRIVTASEDGTARLWDLDGNPLAILRGHHAPVYSAVFSTDGSRVVTASPDATARVWDLDGNALVTLRGDTGVVSAVFNGDGSRIVTVSGDATARLWDLDGNTLATLTGPPESIYTVIGNTSGSRPVTTDSATFSADGSHIVTAWFDQNARVWDGDGNLVATLTGHNGNVYSAVFSPDGSRVVTASDDGTARLWDLKGNTLATLSGHTGPVYSAAFSPDGSRIVTASDDGTARLWDVDGHDLAVLTDTPVRLSGIDLTAVFNGDGSRIVTASNDATARLWDLEGHLLATLTGHDTSVLSAVFSPDGSRIVTASTDGTARLWDLDGNTLATLTDQYFEMNSAVFSPDGSRILTASGDATASVWDLDGNTLATLTGHNDSVYTAVFSPDGSRIVTASQDGTARLWDLDGNTLATLDAHTGPVHTAVFSPDGSRIVTASDATSARLWDLDGNTVATLTGHTGPVHTTVFSPDGSRIVTASDDGTARLWDLDGNTVATLTGHTGPVHSAAFSPDGSRIVTASDDGTARLWDLDGNTVAILTGHTGPVLSAAFSTDGTHIVTAGDDGAARVWPVWRVSDMRHELNDRLDDRQFTQVECSQYRIDPCPSST